MGKKRIVKTEENKEEGASKAPETSSKKHIDAGVLYVRSTYNNTMLTLTDKKGNVLGASSSGALGIRG